MKSRLVLLACCLALLSSCGQGDKGTGKAPEFAVIEAKTTTANLTNSYPATIKGKQDVEIRPMVSGFITKLHVDEGATVRKGQVLFSIDPVQYQAAVNSAKAAVETAKAAVNTQELTVNNKRELNKKNIISDYDLQMAENQLAQTKAQLAQANAQLVNAKNNLSYTSVTSPSDGVVGSIPYRVGSLVSPSVASPLTTVADISEMYAYFSMTERQLLSQIREGGSTKEILEKMPDVQLQLIDGTMYADSGRVETISGVIDQTTGSVTMRALFPNKHNVLRSGSTGNVVFPNPLHDVIMIPQSATTEIQDKQFVFVLQPDNTLKNTEVKVFSLDDGKYYYVTEGLKAIPQQSRFYACMTDVINWHKQYPDDWKKCWEEIEKKWGTNDIACPDGVEVPFNIETYVNGAYIILGLLYGQGDFEKTIDISTRAGQDSDCNPASSGGILGTMLGYNRLPEKYKAEMAIVEDMPFNNTVSFNKGSELSYGQALQMIEREGGKVGENEVKINFQKPVPAKLEISFEGLKLDKKVTVDNWIANFPTVEFDGIGAVIKGELKGDNVPEDYVAELEVYFNDKLVEVCKLPLKYNHRKHELFFNYEQPYGKYKVTCKWTNPVKGADIWVRDVITYTTDK